MHNYAPLFERLCRRTKAKRIDSRKAGILANRMYRKQFGWFALIQMYVSDYPYPKWFKMVIDND